MLNKLLQSMNKLPVYALTAMLLATTSLHAAPEPAPGPTGQKAAASPVDAGTKDTRKPEPDSFRNYLSGRFAAAQGDTKNGVDFLRESFKRDPANKGVAKNLYHMLILAGKVEEAIPVARKLEGVKVVEDASEFSPEMLVALGEVKDGRFDEADRHLSLIPKVGFNSLLVPQMRAWVKLANHQIKAPLDAKSISPESKVLLPQVYLNAALINDLAGFPLDAQKQYETAVKDTRIEPFRAVEALANFYARRGMADKRDQLIKTYQADHGDSYLSDALLGSVSEGKDAKPLVQDAKQGFAEVIFNTAGIFHGIRSPVDEIANLHLALFLRQDFPSAQFLLANAYELDQQFQKAFDTYKAITPDSPYYLRGRIRSAYDLIELGQKEKAIADLDAVSREFPKETDALLAKGDVLRADKRYAEAVTAYGEVLGRVPSPQKRNWIIYFSRGATYQLMGNWEKAEADMKKALALSPKEPEVLNYLGYSWLTMNKNLPEARKMVQAAFEARPEDPQIIDSMGYAFYLEGKFARAQQYFDQALERLPSDPTVNEHLGDAYWQQGRKTEARYQWEKALENKPDGEAEKNIRKKIKDGPAAIAPSKDEDVPPKHPTISKN